MWAVVCWVAAAVGAATGAAAGCDVVVGDETYRREVLLSDVDLPRGLAMDHTNHTLYFSYVRNDNWTSAKLDLRTEALSAIEELSTDCTFAVDRVRGGVYAGCDDGSGGGLHALDANAGRFVPAGEPGREIVFVHYHNDTLYYSFYGSYLLHAFRAGRSVRVPQVPGDVLGLVVDGHRDWIYHDRTGVYRQRAGAGATRYAGVDWPRALADDARSVAYACDNSYGTGGVYRLHAHAPSATRLAGDRCSALAVDRDDNVIYGDNVHHRIVRLVKC